MRINFFLSDGGKKKIQNLTQRLGSFYKEER